MNLFGQPRLNVPKMSVGRGPRRNLSRINGRTDWAQRTCRRLTSHISQGVMSKYLAGRFMHAQIYSWFLSDLYDY